MIIVFCGLDGSGKTTLANEAIVFINSQNNKKAIYRHLIKDSFYYKLLHSFIAKISPGSKNILEKGLREEENKIRGFIVKLLKKALLLLNLVSFNIRFYFYKKSKHKNVICDRYFYDDLVQMEYLNVAGCAFRKFFSSLILKPDLVFFLEVNPEIAMVRKPEYDTDYFKNKSKLYSQFFKKVDAVIVPMQGLVLNKQIILSGLRGLFNQNYVS
ncbi:MAG: hypothetical protein HZC15_04080 [Candidatus Omnitrophica bacterium]|nr:hypothetical protein [Candidatus Omnitrophota bacterium]